MAAGQLLVDTAYPDDILIDNDWCVRVLDGQSIIWERPPKYFFNSAVDTKHDTSFWTSKPGTGFSPTDTYLHLYGSRQYISSCWYGKNFKIPAWAHYLNISPRHATYWNYSYTGASIVPASVDPTTYTWDRGVCTSAGHIGGYASSTVPNAAPGKLHTLDISAMDKDIEYRIVLGLYSATSSRIDIYWDNVYFSPYKPDGAIDLTTI